MTPNTTYNICPELSVNGSNWSGGVAVAVTTLPAPAVHPALPIPPATFNTDYPNTTGYAVFNVASDCSNYKALFTQAVSQRGTTGTVINLPPGVPCAAQMTQYDFPIDPDVKTFLPSAVSTANNTITLPAPVAEGQVIRFGATTYTHLPGSGGNNQAGPIISGMPYYWHVTNGNTGQVYANAPFSQGGALCVLTDQGSANGNGGMAYVTEPRSPNWVIVRTATPDSQFVPEHSRVQGPPTTDGITPDVYPGPPAQWSPLMADLQTPYSQITSNHSTLEVGGPDINTTQFVTNIRFVGIKFDHGPNPYAATSSDPIGWGSWLYSPPETQNIIFDRCWFHNNSTPERMNVGLMWDGYNMAIIDSYLDGEHFFHAATYGLGVSSSNGSNSATVATGVAGFGAGKGTLTTPATISWTGTSVVNAQERAFIYFSMAGNQLNVAFPIGITGTCTGAPNCHVVSLQGRIDANNSQGPAVLSTGTGTTTTFPAPTNGGPNNYYVDPVVSTSSDCSGTASLFSNLNTSAAPPFAAVAGGADMGTQFVSDANQYACGVRFFKNAGDTGTHTGTLWTLSGTQLATGTFSGETASGWQTLVFPRSVGLSAGTKYVVSYHSNSGWVYGTHQFQNADYFNTVARLHVSGAYVDSNGSGNSTDAWPGFVVEAGGYEGPSAGEIGYIDISAPGTTVAWGNADLQTTHTPLNGSGEGGQFMVGGLGPGPYIYRDNFLECTGNCWHHNDGGYFWDPGRNDYSYYRDYWHMPAYTWWTSPYSDGNRYGSRHFLEWKAGKRIEVVGNIFNRWYTDETPTDESVEWSCKVGQCISDVRFEFNSMFHGPGGLLVGGPQEANCCREPAPTARYRIANNLAWDIDGRYCVQSGGFACPTAGWFMQGIPGEDTIVDHNTVLTNVATSGIPVLLYLSDIPVEGVQVTNNFVPADSSRYSFSAGLTGQDSCRYSYVGEVTGNCKLTPSYTWAGNVFLGTGVTAAQIQSAWPTHLNYPNGQPMNYFMGAQGNVFANAGWFNFSPSNTPFGGNFRVKQNFCSGCGQNATDLKDVGADIDALEAAQGAVTLNGVPNSSVTSSSATVVFVAPDSAGCSVDYSSSDSTVAQQFTRASDPGGSRVRNIALNGLSAKTLYYYRVNCAVQQPIGQFRTH